MLILLIGDAHITGKNPICRIDDLTKTQWEKWKEIVSIANKHKCPIISTGDIFNVPIIANSLLTEFGNILEKLNYPLYFVWGNHDLQYHSMDIFDRTSLGMLWYHNNKIRHISEFYNDYGIKWDWGDWNEEIDENDADYLLIHKAIYNPKTIGGNNSWILKDKEFGMAMGKELNKYKLIICGHWHRRYSFTYKETKIINPGPITRRTIEDLKEPSVQLLNLKNGISKIIKLISVKPTNKIISKDHLEQESHKVKVNITEFINVLKNKNLKYSSSFLDNLINLLDTHEIDSKIEKSIRSYIAKLIELKGGNNE